MRRGGERDRREHPALRRGSSRTLHKDHENGVLAVERHDQETGERLIVVVNNGDGQWDAESPYAIHVGNRWENAEGFEEIYNSQDEAFGGWAKSGNAERGVVEQDGDMLPLAIPKLGLIILKQKDAPAKDPGPGARGTLREIGGVHRPGCSVERVKAGGERNRNASSAASLTIAMRTCGTRCSYLHMCLVHTLLSCPMMYRGVIRC